MREQENVSQVAELKPDWMGFIFDKNSPRYFLNAKNKADLKNISPAIKTVGGFVNEDVNEIRKKVEQYQLKAVQLHGEEPPEFCQQIQQSGVSVIKAFRVNEYFDFTVTERYTPHVDYFLFDTKGRQPGGTGIRFNWQLLEGKRFAKPFLLSGGISSEYMEEIKSFHHPDFIGIDINSKFEISPGLKDVTLIRTFLKNIF